MLKFATATSKCNYEPEICHLAAPQSRSNGDNGVKDRSVLKMAYHWAARRNLGRRRAGEMFLGKAKPNEMEIREC